MDTKPSLDLRTASAFASGVAALAVALAVGAPGLAAAQSPDIREIRPVVMMLVDTSGSMEYELGSRSGPGGSFPTCTGNGTAGSTHSRWTALLSAMTGSWENYYCRTVDRSGFVGAPDQHYVLDYHQPFGTSQRTDGILDVYLDRVKFGLMTYDNIFGLDIGGPSNLLMVPPTTWASRSADVVGALGDYSYGPARDVSFPGCGGTFMVNAGARREAMGSESFGGSLISVGTDLDDHRVINARVQAAMLAARPFGSTPTAALLDDFLHYLRNDPDVASSTVGTTGDPYAACRSRYGILITDGQPTDPFRTMGCGTAGYTCPYRQPSEIAADLCAWDGAQCTGPLDGLFVVGYEVNDASASLLLDDIAMEGGTGSSYLASDQAALLASLSAVLDRSATGTTTRTTAVFAESAALFTPGSTAVQQRYQLTSGFVVGHDGAPWTGVLERTRFTCTGPSTPPDRQPLDPSIDSFHGILNSRDVVSRPRALYTAISSDVSRLGGRMIGDAAAAYTIDNAAALDTVTVERGVDLVRLDRGNVALTPAHLGITAGTATARMDRRNAILDWVHGVPGTVRDGARFGDIYHSNPVTVAPPRADLADESYNAFRRLPAVAERPTVLYVGTNDGILHAFAVEEHRLASGRVIGAGEELWGFVPPALLGRLDSASVSHQFMVDGTPVVRDMFYVRRVGDFPSASNYHTTLVAGLRAGGNVYVALDVSDPVAAAGPTFLWQFRRQDMGATYGRPGLAQVFVDLGGGTLEQRAVAILPGGMGEMDLPATLAAGAGGCPAGTSVPAAPPSGTGARTNHRCWAGNTGRALYVVDVATGEVIREFLAADGIGSPITGGVSVFTGDVGTIATRAYVTDADGVLWRLDMTEREPRDWTFRPIHDLYWADGAMNGHTSTEPPIITTDNNDDVVVIVGTGDLDDLEGDERFRIASITDRVRRSGTTTSYEVVANWEIHLDEGEQVTGPLELFDSRVYFGTFASNAGGADACLFGGSRIWGVHYLNTVSSAPTGYVAVNGRFPAAGLQTTAGTGPYDAHYLDVGDNTIVMGVAVTRTPTCVTGTTLPDPYLGNRFTVGSAGGGEFRLVASVSGGRPSGGALTTSGGGAGETAITTVGTTLAMPPSVTYVTDWAGTADY